MAALPPDVTIFRHPHTEGDGTSRTLLRRAAGRYSSLSDAQLGPVETDEWGKPFFPAHPHLHFSVTHSGDWWLCGFSKQPLGLDLQVHRSHVSPETLSRRFFHPLEDAFLAKEGYQRFFDLWCAKESWVKYTGHGFFDIPESFSVVSAEGQFPAMEGAQLRLKAFGPEYSLCLCARQLGQIRILDL